jgi:hypothetical protein
MQPTPQNADFQTSKKNSSWLPRAAPLPELLIASPAFRAGARLAVTFPAQHDPIKQRRIRSAPMMKFQAVAAK